MTIVEMPIFTRRISALLDDTEYWRLQTTLVADPSRGKVIAGTGGIRKLRWLARGRGKSAGVRVIYYWAVSASELLMLYVYPKADQDDLTAEQTKRLRRVVEEEYGK